MARREDFDNSLWSDPDFLALTSAARLVYIWTWTNPRCGMAGIYKLSPAQAMLETGLDEETIASALDELGEARFAFYEGNVVWVRSRVKHLRQKTTQIAVAIRNDLSRIPKGHPLKVKFVETYGGLGWLSTALSGDPHEGPVDPIHPRDGHSTVYGVGTGVGTGGKGWGRGKGNRSAASQVYTPDPEIAALRDAHFPGSDVSTIESIAFTLGMTRREVTPENIREILETRASAAASHGEEAA